jgi:ABC-type lipoprotein export system ATPase subunit
VSFSGPAGAPVPALSLRGLHVQTPAGAPLLSLPSLELDRGAALGLHGPSGCGKSTLLRVIAGLEAVAAGEVWVAGAPVHALHPAERAALRAAQLGFIPQGLHLHPGLSAVENVLLGGIFAKPSADERRDRPARARALLSALGLGARADAPPAALSLGEQQRVAVARALVHRPAVVLADEPTASLDLAAAQAVIDLLQGLCAEQGTALLLVSHDPRALAALPAQQALARVPG